MYKNKKRLMPIINRNSVWVIKLWFAVTSTDTLSSNDLKVALKIRILIIKDMILIINVQHSHSLFMLFPNVSKLVEIQTHK